jgi:phosphoglycolate phosphatase-like HAD superfamily hydrolase
MRERQERILAELSELGLALARDLQARALAADDTAEASELGLAFHRVARSVRQTLALQSRLERDRQRAEREDRADVQRAETARAERRRAQVKFAVERCVFSEADGSEAERLLDELDDRLEEDTLSDAFAGDDPIEAHIARICADLGVEPPRPLAVAGAADAPSDPHPPFPLTLATGEPPAAHTDEPPDWRSSA